MISFETFVSRNIVRALSSELDLAGLKINVNRLLSFAIIGFFIILIFTSYFTVIILKEPAAIGMVVGLALAALYDVAIYTVIEFLVDKRKTFVETIIPDYLQLTAAHVRSGIPLDRAIVMAARPEFKFFSDDVKRVAEQLYSGETIDNALMNLAERYRSPQLKHSMRLIIESVHYGGGISDLLNQIGQDLRAQQLIQKEISSQLFMYTIFIVFAAVIAAPALYGLTSQMIKITTTVWANIQTSNGGLALPSQGTSFLKPNPPQITVGEYQYFAIASIIIISGFCSFILSAISSGTIVRGLKYAPLFIVISLIIFFIVSTVIGGLFTAITG